MATKNPCRDWEPSPHNPKRCKYYRSGGLCMIPGNLRCINWLVRNQKETSIEELLSFADFSRIDRKLAVTNTSGMLIKIGAGESAAFFKKLRDNLPWMYSFSQLLGSYGVCRRKWYWRYLKRVRTLETAAPLIVGSAGHKFLELWHSGKGAKKAMNACKRYAAQECDDKWFLARLRGIKALCRTYKNEPKNDITFETEYHAIHPNMPWHGYFDGRQNFKDSVLAWEHKFTGKIEEVSASWRAQALFYFLLDPGVDTVMFNLFKKPDLRTRLKPQRDETLPDYERRLSETMAKDWPGPWHSRIAFNREAKSVELREFELGCFHLTAELELARDRGFPFSYFPCNTYACNMYHRDCEYKPLCQTGQLDPTIYEIAAGKQLDEPEPEDGDV